MKKAFLLSFFLLFINCVNAQSFNWAFTLDTLYGNCRSEGLSLATDSLGNSYVGGEYTGEVDFDPGSDVDTANSLNELDGGFLAKYDVSGSLVWCNKWPATWAGFRYQSVSYLQFDKLGNLYFVMQRSSWAGGGSTYLYKLDTDSGTFTEVHKFSGTSYSNGAYVKDFAIDDSLNFYLVMSIVGSVNLFPGFVNATSFAFSDILAVKMDSVGTILWAKQLGQAYSDDEAIDIDADAYGNVYFSGIFKDEIDVDPGPDTVLLVANNPNVDTRFMVKLNSMGDYINAKQASSINTEFSKFEINANNQILCIDNNHITLLDSSINNVWKKTFTNATPTNIRLDDNGNIFSFGPFNSNNDFDPGTATYTIPLLPLSNHFFISKLDPNGNFLSALGFHVNSYSKLNAIDVSGQHILLTGLLNDTADMDPYTTVYNLSEKNQAYVCKLSKCIVPGPAITLNGCDSLVVNGQTFFNSGTYSQALRTTAGCDSTFVLNLTIKQSNSSSYTTTACDSLFYNGQYYNTSGLYDVKLTNADGCDSTVHLNLTVNHSYTITKTVTACPGYFFGGNMLTTSGIYYDSLQTNAGCDSIIIINLTVVSTFNTTISPTICQAYVSPAGNVYTTSGTYTDSLVSVNGCDSIITINLTIFEPGNHVYQFNQTLYCNIPNLQYQWVVCNGSTLSPIPGATSQLYTTNIGGSYALVVVQNGCIDTSACFTLATVGISNVEAPPDVFIYPNPVSGTINIDIQTSTKTKNTVAYLYTLQGQVIASYSLDQDHNTINTGKLAAGFYFLKIRAGLNVVTKKILLL